MRKVICGRCRQQVPLPPRHPPKDARGHRLVTVSRTCHGNRCMPMLRLTGKWLRAAGFDRGQAVAVEVRWRRLIVRAVEAHGSG